MTGRFFKTSRNSSALLVIGVVSLLCLVGVVGPAQGQTTTSIRPSTITSILEGLQGGSSTTGTGTTTATGTTSTTEQQVGTTPLTGRQSTISNQFTAATGGAISLRRPGLWVQQGIAEHEGALDIPGDVPEEPPNFFRDTFDLMAQNVLDLFSGILDGVNGLITAFRSSGSGGNNSTVTFVPPPNATTTWQSTPQTIP